MIKMYIGSARWNSKVTIAVYRSPAPATAAASIALRPYRDQALRPPRSVIRKPATNLHFKSNSHKQIYCFFQLGAGIDFWQIIEMTTS